VAGELRKQGYRIWAYSQFPLKTNKKIPHEYFCKPDIRLLNTLYESATILIKASKYDARSCAPIEAMTKGTVTARAIEKGDDDLDHENSIKVGYDKRALLGAAQVLLHNGLKDQRERRAQKCYEHIEKYSWGYWMSQVNEIICK
jgi:hypothetical protein